jgi:trehalose 6-phosphate synthase/phosphatase
MRTSIINVSNRLPVTVEADKITRSSGGLVAALEGLPEQEYASKWIGWPGQAFPDAKRQKEIEQILFEEHGCVPVFLEEEEAEAHYEGFSNSSIWPVLHYLPNYLHYEPVWWEHYQRVNQRFAEKVLQTVQKDELIWVHDYQLMLLPSLLKARAPHLRVGFFLHTPFPAYEVFRCHPRGHELVAGMLGADLIGFHTFGYLRHFCGCVQRFLGIEPELTRIRTENHASSLGVYPIGINAAKFEETLDSPKFCERREEIRSAYEGKQIVLSVERMDYTKGILHRLDAIDVFLAGLESIGEVQFIFVSVPSRERIKDYQALCEEVETRIGRLNGKYATPRNNPIHFIHGSLNFIDLCAMYSLADVALVTPLIDGMNLVAKEYLACQRENTGVLILSEFAGAAEELFSALLVNPYDARGVAETLSAALALPLEARRVRNQNVRERVMQYDAKHWAHSFMDDLIARTPEESGPATELGAVRDQIAGALAGGKRVSIFLDYDGTLREIEADPKLAGPTPELQTLLKRLSNRHNLVVTIVSGRTRDDLEKWFGAYPFGLIAEHGASLRRPGQSAWEELDSSVNYSWKAGLLTILQLYQETIPGSFVEEKRSSIVWHYRKADQQFGTRKAHQLAQELAAFTANEQIQVRHGKKIVEVSAAQVNKGAAVAWILEHDKEYAIALCAGDDQPDESMFKLCVPRLISIKVGEGPTQAQFRMVDPADFRRFLDDLKTDFTH